jgi:hypothetical protein
MSKSIVLSGLSLRSGAILFSLFTALGACATVATPQHGSTTAASIKPSQAAWGYPIGAASSESETHGSTTAASIKPSQAAWGYPIGATSSEPEIHSAAKVSQPEPTTTCSHQPPAPRVAALTSC